MKRWDMSYTCDGESGQCREKMVQVDDGDFVRHADASAEIARLAAERDAARAELLRLERRTWAYAVDHEESFGEPSEFVDSLQDQLDDGAKVRFDICAVLRTETWRYRCEKDEEGTVVKEWMEKDAANPMPETP